MQTVNLIIDLANCMHSVKMETESNIDLVIIEAPSSTAADDYHWPDSEVGEQLSVPYENMDRFDSWKERIHSMMSRFQDRATKFIFKGHLQQLKQNKKLFSLEVILLSCLILIIWIIFTTPTMVFTLSSATEVILATGSLNSDFNNYNNIIMGCLHAHCKNRIVSMTCSLSFRHCGKYFIYIYIYI